MIQLPSALAAFTAHRQFILWKPVPRPDGKVTKKPINPLTNTVSDPHDQSIWVSVDEAFAALTKCPKGWGIGFVFTAGDPFFFIDIDGCLVNGEWSQVAQNICAKFTGCAVEVSQSGTGLHIFGVGMPPVHGCKHTPLGLEFYHELRFAAITGSNAIGNAGAYPAPGALEWLVENYFPPSEMTATPDNWTTEPTDDWNGPTDDQKLISKMLASKSAGSVFGGKASIQDLWNADPVALGNAYPDAGERPFDWSSAEAALCSHLAWWTGKDCVRIDRLMRMSKLFRDKWEKRQPYRQNTILKAVGGCSSVYCARQVEIEVHQTSLPVQKTGFQYLTPDQQLDFFKGCCYIQVMHRVFTPNGMTLKPEQFKAMFGGYTFALDSENQKTTKNAWECFTESQAISFPKATNVVFRPNKPQGAIINEEGLLLFNNYVPLNIDREKGDIRPFTGLMEKLFPFPRDREIITSYMAACVQYPGTKFQWAPLIQGCEGNGKSFVLTAVSRALGVRYTHKPPARDISNVFNSWISGKLFIAVEEVYVHDKREVMDALKTLITDDRVPVTPKGIDQTTGDNCANFMCTSNHKDAIRVAKKNNRRWCIFYTPQQSLDDLNRDGMGGSYFPKLWSWFKGRGHAIISDYLLTYEIPEEFNPATACHRAPWTSSTDEAAEATMGGIEQEILEAVGEGRSGFAGGWVSSMAMAQLLATRRITYNKRVEILTELGYILHPGLPNGRVNSIIPLDGGKPRLYIKKGHKDIGAIGSAEVIKLYIEAQGQNILT